MTEEQIDDLVKYIRLAKQDKILLPNLPLRLFEALNEYVSLPVVEVILVDKQNRFLLTYRDDEHWHGWHIPGGFVGVRESIQNACSRIAMRELGIECTFIKVVNAIAWENNHDFSSPISIFCLCTVKGDKAPQDGTYFDTCPEDTIGFHKAFFSQHWNDLQLNHTM